VTAVGIVGAGAWGTALAQALASAGKRVLLFGEPRAPLPEGARAVSALAELADAVRLVILAVPSPRVSETVRALGMVTSGRHLVVHASGTPVDLGGGAHPRRVSDLVREETPVKRIGALAGPALPGDLSAARPCALVVASAFDEVIAETRAALEVPQVLRIYGSHDLPGVELGAAISGALTIAVGFVDGLGMAGGPRAVIICRAVAEATRLTVAGGGKERTFAGLAGLGNLLSRTSSESSELSDEYRLGLQLARGETPARREPEGARAVAALLLMARRLGVRVPLLAAVSTVLYEGVPIRHAAAKLAADAAAEEE